MSAQDPEGTTIGPYVASRTPTVCSAMAMAWSAKPALNAGWPQQVWSKGNATSNPARSRISTVAMPTRGAKPSTRQVTNNWQTPGTAATIAVGYVPVPMDVNARHRTAIDLLVATDGDLAAVVERFGRPAVFRRPPTFATLVLLILEQQVSLSSAAATFRRLTETGAVEPAALLGLDDPTLQQIGFSRQKVRYVRALAEAVTSDRLPLDRLPESDDDEVRLLLTAIPGIGPWTADVFLLSCLDRPDIWPTGDRALQVGAADVLSLAEVPSEPSLAALGERWRPLRSTAAQLIWHDYLSRRGRTG